MGKPNLVFWTIVFAGLTLALTDLTLIRWPLF